MKTKVLHDVAQWAAIRRLGSSCSMCSLRSRMSLRSSTWSPPGCSCRYFRFRMGQFWSGCPEGIWTDNSPSHQTGRLSHTNLPSTSLSTVIPWPKQLSSPTWVLSTTGAGAGRGRVSSDRISGWWSWRSAMLILYYTSSSWRISKAQKPKIPGKKWREWSIESFPSFCDGSSRDLLTFTADSILSPSSACWGCFLTLLPRHNKYSHTIAKKINK